MHRPEEIEMLAMQAYEHGGLAEEPLDMIRGVFDLSERTVADVMVPRTSMVPLSTTRRNLETIILNLSGWTSGQKAKLASALSALIRPNVVLDPAATTEAREKAASQVPSVVISLKRGQFSRP